MRTLIVHEWLTNNAGSERVVAALRSAYPGAMVATSMRCAEEFADWEVVTSFLQRAATGPGSHVRVLPLMPLAFRTLRLPPADFVISSFHTFSLQARVPADVPHLVYCYTPPRFLWHLEQFGSRRGNAVRTAALAPLRAIDRRRARRPAQFVGISRAVASRIRAVYGVDSEVVHPPVAVEQFAAASDLAREDYYLVLSRLVPYKQVDLAIAAFNALGWPLVIAGDGRAAGSLKAAAGRNIRFVGHVADADLPALMGRARGLVFPGEDDFGIVPVEAMAAGTPVVAFQAGGALDTVQEGRSGVFFGEPTVAALTDALRRAAAVDWDHTDVSRSVARFAEARFRAEMIDITSAMVA